MAFSKIKTAIIVTSVAALMASAGFAREMYNNYQVDREIKRLEERAKALEAERISILALKERLASQDFLEGEARLKFGLKKPGETAIIIPESRPGSAEELKRDLDDAQGSESNARQWFNYFFE